MRGFGLASVPFARYLPRDDPYRGEVAEWSNAAVSKTVVGLRRPRVRIPVSPPIDIDIKRFYCIVYTQPAKRPAIRKTTDTYALAVEV